MQIGSSHNEPISPKFLKKSPKIKSSQITQKSNSPFPSMSAAGLLGPNLVFINAIMRMWLIEKYSKQKSQSGAKTVCACIIVCTSRVANSKLELNF